MVWAIVPAGSKAADGFTPDQVAVSEARDRGLTMGSGIYVEVVSDGSGFEGLKPDWDRLSAAMEVPSPFHSWEWVRTWWKHFGARRRMRIAVLREGENVVGIAPLYLVRYGPLLVLVPMGWPDRLTEMMEPIVPPQDRDRVEAALMEWLVREHPVGLATGLSRSVALRVSDRALESDVYYDWRPLPESWDALLDGLHRSMRGNTRYYPRLLQRGGHSLAFRVADGVDSVRAALPTLYALHTARSDAPSGEKHLDRLRDSVRRSFLDEIAGLLAERGEMKIGILAVDGHDVAAQLWFEQEGTMFLHYSGYDPEWSRFSVAMIVTSEIIRLGIERGMKRVEFLRGSKQFKTRWNTNQRKETDVYFVRYPWLLPMFHRVRSLRRKLRSRTYRRTAAQPAVEAMAGVD